MERSLETTPAAQSVVAPALLRWAAVFAGVVLGFAALIVLVLAAMALAAGQPDGAFAARLSWWLVGAAVFALFIGGFSAGWLSGVPRVSAGIVNGLTVWGLILIGAVAVGLPGLVRFGGLSPALTDPVEVSAAPGLLAGYAEPLWTTLLAVVVAALAAGLGGALGGALTRVPGITLLAGVTPARPAAAASTTTATRTARSERGTGAGAAETTTRLEPGATTRLADPPAVSAAPADDSATAEPATPRAEEPGARTVDLRERVEATRADGAAFRRGRQQGR